MGLRRIKISRERISPGRVRLGEDEYNYLCRVLRLGSGGSVLVFDGQGSEYSAILLEEDEGALLEITGIVGKDQGPELRVTLLTALLRNRNFDLVARKSAELGATVLVPVITGRTVREASSGVERWRRISAEASRQCGRSDVMEVREVTSFEDALNREGEGFRLVAWEGGVGRGVVDAIPLAEALSGFNGGGIAVAVGPEGGFCNDEIGMAVEKGFVPVSLGKRILRGETVPLAMLSVLQFLFGDLG